MERQQQLEALIKANFTSDYVDLVNESHMHSVPKNSETHFKLTLVTKDFEGVNKVKRHQRIYSLVNPLMEQGLHALALHTYTPDEWQAINETSPASPNCKGGSKLYH
jgi:BolA protein